MAKKLTKKQKAGKKAARTKKDKKLAAQARGLKSRGKRPDKTQMAALKRVEKKAKKKKAKAKKPAAGRRPKSKKPKSRKSKSKKSKSRKKNPAAATKPAKRAKPRKSGKKKKAGKGRRKGVRSPERVYEATLLTQQRCERKIAKLKMEGNAAIGKEKERKVKERARLEAKLEHVKRQLAKSQAAAESKKKRKGGKRRGKGKRRNPVNPVNPFNPIEGWGQAFAAGSGAVVGAIALVGGDRFFAGHALTGAAPSFSDQPAQGAVYNVSAASLPLWANFKQTGWKRTANAMVNVGLPLLIGSKVEHEGGKTFFQLWGYMAAGLTIGKVAIDLAAKMFGTSALGLRMFSQETTAVALRTQSLASQPAAVTVVEGQGFQPALTGYGRSQRHATGHGKGCQCADCCVKGSQVASMGGGCPPAQPGQPQGPAPTPTPLPGPGGTVPGGGRQGGQAPPAGAQPTVPPANPVLLGGMVPGKAVVVGSSGNQKGAGGTLHNIRSNDGPYTGRVGGKRI